MSPHAHRRLTLDLPPLRRAQAEAVFELLCELQDAFWCAYEDQLLDAALAHAVAAQDEDRELEALDAAIWGTPADRT